MTRYTTLPTRPFAPEAVSKWCKLRDYELLACDVAMPVVRRQYILMVGTVEEFDRYILDKHGIKPHLETALAAYAWYPLDGALYHYILFTENDWAPADYGSIAHEVHHVIHLSLQAIGIRYARASEEVFAYAAGYLMEMIVRAFVELKKWQEKPKPQRKRKGKHS